MNNLIFPRYLMVQTVSGCNGNCYFCPYPYLKKEIKRESMDFKLFKNIIDQCREYEDLKIVMPYLMNEPLLDRSLDKKIAYIKRSLPLSSVHILTNSSLLDRDMSIRLLESGLDWIGFSLHGITEDTIRNTMGLDLNLILDNISNFITLARKNGKDIERFILATVIKNKLLTDQELERTVDFWKEAGIKRISKYASPISRAGNVPSLVINDTRDIYGCGSIWANEMMHIVSSGDVVPCCMDWKQEVLLGNIKEDSLYDIWHSKRYDNFRKKRDGKEKAEKGLICLRCECAQREPRTKNDKVTLVIVPPWGVERPPIGLAVIAQALRDNGCNVNILDLNLKIYDSVDEEDKERWGMDQSLYFRDPEKVKYLIEKYPDLFSEIESQLISDDSAITAFSLPTNSMYLMFKWGVEKIKHQRPDKKIILGGISVTVKEQRDELFNLMDGADLIDAVVLGEGEETILELAEKIRCGKTIADTPGALIIQNGNLIETEPRIIKDLDKYSLPKYEGFPLSKYTKNNSISLEFSRGCIGKCNFCSFKILSSFYKKKSPQRIIDELRYYKEKLDKEYFSIVDSSLNADLRWLELLVDMIIKENLALKFTALAIPRGDMSLKLLRKMRKAGFYRLEYGVESGSNRILKLMGKTFSARDAERALSLTKRSGIQNILYFIVGFPTEKHEDFQKTLDFIEKNRENIDYVKSVNPLFLMAGSKIFANPEMFNIKIPDKEPDIKWFIEGENDFSLRMERVETVHRLLERLGIPYTTEATALPRERENDLKTKDIALVTTAPWGINNPPLALGYLASYLRKHGFEPAVFDYNIDFYNSVDRELKRLWHVENKNFWRDIEWFNTILKLFDKNIDSAVDRILKSKAKIIGFSAVDPKERLTIEFIKRIKSRDMSKKIIIGGPAVLTAHSRKIFLDNIAEYIDFFVIGEGEETLLEIMQNKALEDVPGAIRLVGGRPGILKERDVIRDLDSLPYPNYSDFNLKIYPGDSLILEWSRGCIGKCVFCINHELVKGYRSRSAELIIEELKYHKDINCIKRFTICDPLLNGSPRILEELCGRIIDSELDIEWTGEVMPRDDMGLDIFKKMKQAGCRKLQIGLESGSDKVLKKMGKIYSVKTAESFLKKASIAGIETELFVMIGFPSEGEAEFRETEDFLKRNQNYINTIKSINTLHLMAGTRIYRNYSKYNIKELPQDNWHYEWRTEEGNDYQVRKRRGELLLDLADRLGFKVMETNLEEGKQGGGESFDSQRLKALINSIQELPQKRKSLSDGFIIPRRRIFKLPYLVLIISLTLMAESYLWFLKKVRRMVIFPGS